MRRQRRAAARRPRWLAWLAAVAMALTVMSAPAATAAPVAAVAGYGGCLLAQKSGDLLILFDESGSLEDTDAERNRVKAASYLVRQMLIYASQNDVELDVAVAGFSDSYQQATPWTRLDPTGATTVQRTITSFGERTHGFETDYWTALTGAREALVAHAAGDADRCQAVVWFSDGRLSLSKRSRADEKTHGPRKAYAPDVSLRTKQGTERAEEMAAADLCRPEGVANQLRARHITVLAIGLTSEDAPASDFALMRRIAEGADCGKTQQPPGHFWPVGDIDQMLAAFDQVANPGGQQTREFVLDDALNRVHIFGTGQPGLVYTLVAPDGQRLLLRRGESSQQSAMSGGGVNVSWEWLSTKTLTVDLSRRSGKSWTGRWSVKIEDPNGDRGPDPTISLSGDLYPAWAAGNAAELHTGDQALVQLGLAGADGKAIKPQDLLGTASLSATLITPDGGMRQFADQLGKSQISRARKLDLTGVPVGAATVRLVLTYTTAKVGNDSTTLEPQQVDVPVDILAPPDSGRLVGQFDFGASDQAMDTTAAIQVEGPSCVWLTQQAPAVTAAPTDIDPVSITSAHNTAATCLKVPAGQTAPLEARLQTGAAGNGSLVGTLEVNQSPIDEPARATAVQVQFGAEMSKPLKILNFALALIVALILGPGIPLGLLYLAKHWTAKIPGHPLEAVRFPVELVGEQLLVNGQPVSLGSLPRPQAVDLLEGGSRTANAAGVELRTGTGRSPFGAGFVEAVLPGLLGVSSSHDRPSGKSRAARLPLAVHNTWAAFIDPSSPAGSTVLLLRGLDVTDAQRREQLDDLQDRLPALLRDVSSENGPSAPRDPGADATAPDDPFGYGGDESSASRPTPRTGPAPGPAPGSRPGRETPSTRPDTPPADFDFGFGDDGSR